jgi:hypothetical protein
MNRPLKKRGVKHPKAVGKVVDPLVAKLLQPI